MSVDDDQLLAIQNDLQESLKVRDKARERAVARKLHELEQKHNFLKHFAQVSELLEPMVKDGQAKVKPADKMLMLPALFDGKKPEKAKTHNERFIQYIKFQTKEGNKKMQQKKLLNYLNIHLIRKHSYGPNSIRLNSKT